MDNPSYITLCDLFNSCLPASSNFAANASNTPLYSYSQGNLNETRPADIYIHKKENQTQKKKN